MRRLLELSLVAAAALLAAGCGRDDSTTPEGCGPESCAGCCDKQGRCQDGDAIEACGAGGVACEACAAEGACRNGECVMPIAPGSDAGLADSGEEPSDAALDAGSDDAGAADGGEDASIDDAGLDGSIDDAGELDAGGPDAGWQDAGASDAGEPDTGWQDAGASDAGELDAGDPDAGWQDAGAPDSGEIDGGGPDAGPVGESCGNPIVLTPGATTTTVTGSTAGMADDAAGPCGGAGAADVVYAFTLAASSDVRIQAVAGDASLRPVLYLRGAGCSAPEIACSQAPAAGGEAFLQLHALAAGLYYLWIDGADGTEGSYALTIAATPPASGDSCLAPMPIDLSSGSAQAFGDTRPLANDASSPTCGGASGRDLVFSLHASTDGTLTAVVTPNTSTFQPVLYLRSASCEGSEVACQQAADVGFDATLEVPGLPAGDYFLWVDGLDPRGGSFMLDVSFTP